MGVRRAPSIALSLLIIPWLCPISLPAQEVDRIWGRVHTVSGDVLEGFIRWDRNEGSWADLLDGTKKVEPFQFQDWWELAHPGNRTRERVIEVAGYRVTWDDDEPELPSSAKSGIRFGQLRRLTVAEDTARLELRSGLAVELWGGSTDLGDDLREILVTDSRGRVEKLGWEDLDTVEFRPAPVDAQSLGRRLHGTVEVKDGPQFSGYLAWNVDQILTTDTLAGADSEGKRRRILFGDITTIRPTKNGAEIVLVGGERVELSGTEVDHRNDGLIVSDPDLGSVDVDWQDLIQVTFDAPESPVGMDSFDGGLRLRGTVTTADSTELTGWIKWDGDEEYSWELLDGDDDSLGFSVEFEKIAAIEKSFEAVTSINLGPTGMSVQPGVREREVLVTLRDGRVFELGGSNDVDESNHGIFVLSVDDERSPDDADAQWVMVRWTDFRAVRFDWEEGR